MHKSVLWTRSSMLASGTNVDETWVVSHRHDSMNSRVSTAIMREHAMGRDCVRDNLRERIWRVGVSLKAAHCS